MWLRDFNFSYCIIISIIHLIRSLLKHDPSIEEWLMVMNSDIKFNPDKVLKSAVKMYKLLPVEKIKEWEQRNS